MSDEELCKALVKAGIIERTRTPHVYLFEGVSLAQKEVITDWRVAGRCLELMDWGHFDFMTAGGTDISDLMDPRSIIEGFVYANNS